MVHRLGLCGRAPHATRLWAFARELERRLRFFYNADYLKAELATSHDSLAALDYFSGQGFVDPNLVV